MTPRSKQVNKHETTDATTFAHSNVARIYSDRDCYTLQTALSWRVGVGRCAEVFTRAENPPHAV
jgi:hypothetical protein